MTPIQHIEKALRIVGTSLHGADIDRRIAPAIERELQSAIDKLKAQGKAFSNDCLPGSVVGSEPSEDAAYRIKGYAKTARERVLNFIQGRGHHGATDYEIEQSLNIKHQTCSPRRRELVQAGLVEDAKKRRSTGSGFTATVWRAVSVSPEQPSLEF